MTPSWSEALEQALVVIETWPSLADLARVCVIRDLRGQLRIIVRPRASIDLDDLQGRLVARIGAWFAGPILSTQSGAIEAKRLANEIMNRKTSWPDHWPKTWSDGLGINDLTPGLWCGEQRWRSKDVWLAEGKVELPWPLVTMMSKPSGETLECPLDPVLVSFYSFKGGVGRTTTLGIVAHQLAHMGKHVAVLDLDLEAPGLSPLFDVDTERGVLDLLTEHHATGTLDEDTLDAASRRLNVGAGSILVFPVGRLTDAYVEQLASLDFTPRVGRAVSAHTVEQSLRAILKLIRKKHSDLNYLLIDARAGMHDLGGLSLHALSHVDMLVGRANRATREGFAQVLRALARRRKPEDLRVIVAQTFVPLDNTATVAHQQWTHEMFDLFREHIYPVLHPDDDLPEVMAADAEHRPMPIPQYDSIARVDRLSDIDDSVLNATPYGDLARRIIELARRPMEEPDEDQDD